jgi:hypothetical protein
MKYVHSRSIRAFFQSLEKRKEGRRVAIGELQGSNGLCSLKVSGRVNGRSCSGIEQR